MTTTLIDKIKSKFPTYEVISKESSEIDGVAFHIFVDNSMNYMFGIASRGGDLFFPYGRQKNTEKLIPLPTDENEKMLFEKINQLIPQISWCPEYFNPARAIPSRLEVLWKYFMDTNRIDHASGYMYWIPHTIGFHKLLFSRAMSASNEEYMVEIGTDGIKVQLSDSDPILLLQKCQNMLRKYYFDSICDYTKLNESTFVYEMEL